MMRRVGKEQCHKTCKQARKERVAVDQSVVCLTSSGEVSARSTVAAVTGCLLLFRVGVGRTRADIIGHDRV